jgi:hypothetical protein
MERINFFLAEGKRIIFNRQTAVLVGTLLIMIRQWIYSIILRGRWWQAVTSWFERRQQLKAWVSSKHAGVVQCALYSLSGYRVEKRTLFEEHIISLLYQNKAAGQQMIQAAKLCSKDLPFVTQHLDLTHPLLNALLNRLSSLVAADHIKVESSALYQPIWYVFAILGYSPSLGFNDTTNSLGGSSETKKDDSVDRRSSKIRVVVVREEVLQNLKVDDTIFSNNDDAKSMLISERHQFRLDILKKMKIMYEAQQDSTITSVVDRIAGTMTSRHLMRVQMGYTLKASGISHLNMNLNTPGRVDNYDSPMMFSPRR